MSVSDRAKGWYRRFSGTIVKRVEDNDTLMKTKEETRNKMKDAGLLFFPGIVHKNYNTVSGNAITGNGYMPGAQYL